MIHDTPEEEAYGKLLCEKRKTLSKAAHNLLLEAHHAAYAETLVYNYLLSNEEYDEAVEKMGLAATELTDKDREALVKIAHAGMLAARSIDPDDFRPVGYKVEQGDYHYYYSMVSNMIKRTLRT